MVSTLMEILRYDTQEHKKPDADGQFSSDPNKVHDGGNCVQSGGRHTAVNHNRAQRGGGYAASVMGRDPEHDQDELRGREDRRAAVTENTD